MMEHRGFMWDFIDFIGHFVDKMSHTAARRWYRMRLMRLRPRPGRFPDSPQEAISR
jgi:hypothetical protein